MANTITITDHGLNSGAKVILKDFIYDSNTINLNGRFFYVKVIDSNTISLYYDKSLTVLQDLTGVSFDANSQIVPVEFQATATYNTPGGFTADGRGILSRFTQNINISTNSLQRAIDPSTLSSYIPGVTDVVITISPGIYVYSDNNSIAGLTIGGTLNNFTAGDTVKLTNNGYIMGRGGTGATGNGASNVGSPGMNIYFPITLTNNSYIAGGGGGGGGMRDGPSGVTAGGGGGAGGGTGGSGTGVSGGAGGGVGASGGNGSTAAFAYGTAYGGGGGGRILPGTGGGLGTGGGAGGGGGRYNSGGGSGGSANAAGSSSGGTGGGGGGGWGAAGGNGSSGGPAGRYSGSAGSAGGKAINLNGNTVTYITTGTLYGAVS